MAHRFINGAQIQTWRAGSYMVCATSGAIVGATSWASLGSGWGKDWQIGAMIEAMMWAS
jgi:hypothetical protein